MGRFTHLLASGLGPRRSVRGALRDTGPPLVMSTVWSRGRENPSWPWPPVRLASPAWFSPSGLPGHP
jgi:hypothetical protein